MENNNNNDESWRIVLRNEYQKKVVRLRGDERNLLEIFFKDITELILENIDEFCEALSCAKSLEYIHIGGVDSRDWPKLDAAANAAAWEKLCTALTSIEAIRNVYLGGFFFSGEILARLVGALPSAKHLSVYLPWHTISGADMHSLVEALSNRPEHTDTLYIANFIESVPIDVRDVYLSGEPTNRLEEGRPISELLRLECFKTIWIKPGDLSLEECKSLGEILSTNSHQATELYLDSCNLVGHGGNLMAEAFRHNTTLKSLRLNDVSVDKCFWDSLIVSLSLNSSIESLTLNFCGKQSGVVNHVIELTAALARRNGALKTLEISDLDKVCSLLSRKYGLRQIIEQSYTLEHVKLQGREVFKSILRLNRAGRRYMLDDANSKEKCVAVLGKVSRNVPSLFFHLRENPVLFAGGNGRRDARDKKRKANNAGDASERAAKRPSH